MENKKEICDALFPVLKMTKNLQNLKGLEYRHDSVSGTEVVICTFTDELQTKEHMVIVDVTADSGIAMINDLICQIV